MNDVEWLHRPPAPHHRDALHDAQARQEQLTKPPGALGRLETLAITLAAMQGTARPRITPLHMSVFAGDHGVAAEGVSAFPQAVTAEMVRNFARGGAAISVLARELDAALEVINLGTVVDPGPMDGVISLTLGPGTANFMREPAMTEDQLVKALDAGREAVDRALAGGARLFIGGEMGIGNTTSASALACALLEAPAGELTGPGTGLDAKGVVQKARVIGEALALHAPAPTDALEILRRLGGFEIAALAGGYIACAQRGLPTLIDGFISSVAALAAERLCKGAARWFLFSHASAEPGHRRVLEALDAHPLLDLGLRLGEGSGAALAVPLLRMACALHNGMATFTQAQVSEKL